MPILSISSRVVQGYVGNSAIVPGLQSLGFTVWPLDTVVFSNHPGHGRFRGTITDPAHLLALLEGLQEEMPILPLKLQLTWLMLTLN